MDETECDRDIRFHLLGDCATMLFLVSDVTIILLELRVKCNGDTEYVFKV